MNELDRQAKPLRAALLVHHERRVGRNDVFGAGAMVVVHLVVTHPRGNRLLEDREGPTESAALVWPVRFHELNAFHLGQEIYRFGEKRLVDLRHLGLAQSTKRCAPVMKPDLMPELGPGKWLHLDHIVQEFD